MDSYVCIWCTSRNFFLLDCYVGISRTFRIDIQWIVTLLSRALLRSSFNGLLSQYLAHFKDSLSLDCYVLYLTHFKHSFSLDCNVSISRTFRIFFIKLLHQSLAHFQDSFSLNCYVSISSTFRVLIDMECYVSLLCPLGFIFDGSFVSISRTLKILSRRR